MIAILFVIGVDRYRRSQSQCAVGYRPIMPSIEPIDGFPGVYRQLLDSYRDMVILVFQLAGLR